MLTLFESLGDPDKNCSRAATVLINCLLKERGSLLQEKVRRGGAWVGPSWGGRGVVQAGHPCCQALQGVTLTALPLSLWA